MSQKITLADAINNHVLFSALFLKVLDKDKKVVPLHLNHVQKDVLRRMTGRTIILKSRQMGVSTLMQSLLYRLAITRTISGLVLSHEDRSTQAFRRMFTRFQEFMPAEYRPTFSYNNRTIISIKDTDSEIVVATAGGSGNVGRGFSFSHLHLSEYAFINDPKPLLAGALQSGNPKVVIESTANGTGNHFYELCMEAITEPELSVWRLLFYPWWVDLTYRMELNEPDELGELTGEEQILIETQKLSLEQIKWRRQKIKELGSRLFQQEYPETPHTAFLTSGTGYFSSIGNLDDIFTAPTHAEYDESKTYIAGLDLGRTQDYSVLSVFDSETGNEVEIFRINNVAWSMIIEHIVRILRYWNVRDLWVESNNIGSVVNENLADRIESIPELSTRVKLFTTTSRTKPQIVNMFYSALEKEEIHLLPYAVGKQEIYNFTAKQTQAGNWQFAAMTGHDDTVMARMIANYGLVMKDVALLDFV